MYRWIISYISVLYSFFDSAIIKHITTHVYNTFISDHDAQHGSTGIHAFIYVTYRTGMILQVALTMANNMLLLILLLVL